MTSFRIIENNLDSEFVRLAESLLWENELVVSEASYNFTEIEFYYYSKNHQDAFAHEHKEEAGKWRFHNHGFDITLKGEKGYGGILIRGVETNGVFINGPRRVIFEMMSHLNPVNELKNTIGIRRKMETKTRIFRTFRHGLNHPDAKLKCDNPDYFKNVKYRFIVYPQSFVKTQFQGAEAIARSFNDHDLAFAFLGYRVKF